MDTILLIILVSLLGTTLAILYLNIRSKPKSESKESEEIANLKTEIVTLKDTLNNTINTSLGTMSTSFNALSTGVTKDMTEALTKVDEIVINNGVKIMGETNILNKLPVSASNLYAKNMFNFVNNLYDKEKKSFEIISQQCFQIK